LKFGFDLISDVSFSDQFFSVNKLVSVDDYFLDFSISVLNGYYFLLDSGDLQNFLMNDWNFNGFFTNGLDDLVDSDENWGFNR
jgi:hypothetical protein